MPFLAAIAVALVGVGIAVVVAGRYHRSRLGAWESAAETLGMQVEPGALLRPMRMSGVVDGFTAQVWEHRQSSGNSSAVYTRYRVGYPSLRLGLRLARESGYTRLVRIFGAQDLEIGDEGFDAAFEIKTTDPAAVSTFLTAGRREALLRLLASHPDVVISDDEISLQRSGVERDANVLISTVRRLAAAASTLTDDRLADRIRRKIAQRVAGDLAASVPPTRIHPHPDDVNEAMLAVEGLYGSGRREEAAEVAEALSRRLPADPDVSGLKAQSAPPAAQEPRAAATDTDPVAVAKALFGESRLSFETTRLFEERFAGTPIDWTGTVRRWTTVDSDRDFDGAAITKAVVQVATIANDLYGQTEVDAVVAFPTKVRLGEGAEVRFRGRLVKVDGLIRNIFVADGELLER